MAINDVAHREARDSARAMKPARLLLNIVLGVAVGALIVWGLQGRLYANTGISTDKLLFWASPGPLQTGDWVTFILAHPMLPHSARVVKEVRCGPGQYLKVTDQAAYCDGELLGPKKKRALDGRPMPKWTYDGVIPPGKYFVMNRHRDSFDSRYYGLRDRAELKRLVVLF